MARVLTKKSTVPGKVPLAADLEIGELAVNTADAKLFTKHSDNTIKQLGGDAASSFFSLVTVTATSASQTSFTIPGGYTPGAIVVFLNGSSLAPAHYTATNGTAVVLASGADVVVGSELVALRLSAFEVADALPLGGTAADSSKLGGQPPEFYLGGGSWGSITGTLANQTDLQTALNSKANSADIDFTIIYPNGGTAASPASVVSNSRYAMTNPFPGHRVFAFPEIRVGAQWGDPCRFTDAGSGQGVWVSQLNDGDIIIQTGNHGVSAGFKAYGTPWLTDPGLITSAPCRVRVWKLKGAV
ncbi:hypothetical protein [Stutzerimonas stutzeri]|uniref:hypothetical protein n=1 Tax=Stutzerimonas stutzeri TaxID=316 RepID=UPI0015E473DC|nr:hypothetical protein [Stutzerimonas stutzeri]MBA1227852.1 hypothetical protein [Stutzerimonas stutzeri]